MARAETLNTINPSTQAITKRINRNSSNGLNCSLDSEALALFKKTFAIEPGWRTLTPRLPKSGLLPEDPKLIERITQP
jgi:hypothetical protein